MKLTRKQRIIAKRNKKDVERDKVFNRYMEENYPIAYKLNEMNYKIVRR